MREGENENPDDVKPGDVYEDLDKGRPERRLKVLEIDDGVVLLINTKTERMSRIRLDRLRAGSSNSHGYARVELAAPPTTLPTPNALGNLPPGADIEGAELRS
jgi:hypothetical protein